MTWRASTQQTGFWYVWFVLRAFTDWTVRQSRQGRSAGRGLAGGEAKAMAEKELKCDAEWLKGGKWALYEHVVRLIGRQLA